MFRVLTQQARLPEEVTSPRLSKIIKFFKPAFRVFAALLLLLSLFFIICLIITQIDKAQHSYCGFKCGFLIDKPYVSNPIDYLLTKSSKVFPLDYIILGLLILFVFTCTISGIRSIGIKLPFFKVLLLFF